MDFETSKNREEWDAAKAEGKEGADAWQADRTRSQQEDIKKWMDRARAIEELRPTGNLVADARDYFKLLGDNPEEIESPYGEAFREGEENEALILEYFKDQKRIRTENRPPGGHAGQEAYYTAVVNFVEKLEAQRKS